MPIIKLSRISRVSIFIFVIASLILLDRAGSRFWELPTPVERLELYLVDAALRLRGAQTPSSPIVIVTIDDNSLNYTGYHWPWPRTYLAEIIKALDTAGARVIGFDVMLFGNDPDPSGDEVLAQAIAGAGNGMSQIEICGVVEFGGGALDGFDDALTAVAGGAAPEAGGAIEDRAAVGRVIVHPLGAHDHARVGFECPVRRERHPE